MALTLGGERGSSNTEEALENEAHDRKGNEDWGVNCFEFKTVIL